MQEGKESVATNHSAVVFSAAGNSSLSELLSQQFNVFFCSSMDEIDSVADDTAVVLVDVVASETDAIQELCKQAVSQLADDDVPVLIYTSSKTSLNTLSIFDAGVADILDDSMDPEDLLARVSKSVFHTIANRQLKSRLQQANEMAFSAMSDTSDLGVNIQFLIHCHECDNLDELGMLLFRTLTHYQLNCSLQIRSQFDTKNMEPNGLAKDLEARLLWELKDNGRYVDFGRRCVMNYGQLSLLVKNMPEDGKRFGTIKDNVFPLLQGADARVKSIDNAGLLVMERDLMKGMSAKMQSVMHQVDERYQVVMRQCAELVEDMAMRVDDSIMFLDLNEQQEATFGNIMQNGVNSINELFNQGVRIDESFRKLIDYMNQMLDSEQEASVEQLQSVLDKL